ncbi:glutamate racemase [Ideonella livida]|uniref:Glutamate racemase n=1 Tax=Ideonella livida TaxID=2707176 RepID=A0A7C9TJN0_9BURK|nr:glutamate racemase [Ideonella livida]NDY90725.1 glutamate racemase [Ideonella livida]
MSDSLSPQPDTPLHVGMFDSGLGGLSVLKAALRDMPGASFTYLADSGFAPYGHRPAAVIVDRSERIGEYLLQLGADMVVVACNTATTQAIASLRKRWPHAHWVGVEPGIKPAVKSTRNGRVGVMATPGTLSSARYAELLRQHAPHITCVGVACEGLAGAIEGGPATAHLVESLLDLYCAQMSAHKVDTVVLGCTHYPLVADQIRQRLPSQTVLIDTAEAVSRRIRHLASSHMPLDAARVATPVAAQLQLLSTGDPSLLAQMATQHLGLGALEASSAPNTLRPPAQSIHAR